MGGAFLRKFEESISSVVRRGEIVIFVTSYDLYRHERIETFQLNSILKVKFGVIVTA